MVNVINEKTIPYYGIIDLVMDASLKKGSYIFDLDDIELVAYNSYLGTNDEFNTIQAIIINKLCDYIGVNFYYVNNKVKFEYKWFLGDMVGGIIYDMMEYKIVGNKIIINKL